MFVQDNRKEWDKLRNELTVWARCYMGKFAENTKPATQLKATTRIDIKQGGDLLTQVTATAVDVANSVSDAYNTAAQATVNDFSVNVDAASGVGTIKHFTPDQKSNEFGGTIASGVLILFLAKEFKKLSQWLQYRLRYG